MDSPQVDATDARSWTLRMDTPWGRLQATLLRERLLQWLGSDPLGEVLDVGCGLGDLAAALAARSSRVTCVDRSAAMLEQARRALAGSEASTAFVLRDLDAGLDDLGQYGVVVAHNVLDYTSDPQKAIGQLAARMTRGGRISLSFGNGAAQALRHAVMTSDLDGALELARRPEIGRLPGPCGGSLRLRRSIVEGWLEDEGISVSHRAGVRVLVDLLPNEIKTDQTMPTIEALEFELGEKPELIDTGAIVHLLAARP
ncbi:MAG: class I SAM-dependent methyltransferase [Microthrixaceae bacterium]